MDASRAAAASVCLQGIGSYPALCAVLMTNFVTLSTCRATGATYKREFRNKGALIIGFILGSTKSGVASMVLCLIVPPSELSHPKAKTFQNLPKQRPFRAESAVLVDVIVL